MVVYTLKYFVNASKLSDHFSVRTLLKLISS